MKIIKPETPQKQEVNKEETSIINDKTFMKEVYKGVDFFNRQDAIQDTQSIEDIMNDVINNGTKNITFTITLTKRQHELWLKKGGEAWLKKALVGQGNIRRKSTRKA